MNIFLEFTAIVLLATIFSICMRLLKQPLVIGYILTGIFIGPTFFNLLQSKEYIELFSKIGITILLFIVGLNLSPRVIREVGKVSFLGGLAQIVMTSLFGFIATKLLGVSLVDAVYSGLALSFSSTIIILKILSDKGELQKVYAKITIGFLLVQDVVAIGALMFISSFAGGGTNDVAMLLVVIVVKALVIFGILYMVSVYILPRAIHFFAASQELLFLFSISWGLGLACMFYLLGFSVEVGALLAGITISSTHYADGIASRLKPLRDFFIVLFFILLGSQMVFSTLNHIVITALILTVFVLVGKPIIVFIILNVLGYKPRPAFQTAVSLAQVSEFSLIVLTLGISKGHISVETIAIVTVVALLSIAGSSYLMLYSDYLFEKVAPYLKIITFRKHLKQNIHEQGEHDLILFGYDRVGSDFVQAFAKLDKKYVVIDFNPDLIKTMHNENIPFKYGDVEDTEFLQELNLKKIKLCVSTIPYVKINTLLIKKIRAVNTNAIIIVRAKVTEDAKTLYELGASYVVMPHYLGARYATNMIARIGLDPKGFEEEKNKHLQHVYQSR